MDAATGLARELLTDAQQGIDADRLELCRAVLRQACANLSEK